MKASATVKGVSPIPTEDNWKRDFIAEQLRLGKAERTISAYAQDLLAFENWFELHNGQVFTPELINNWDLQSWRSWSLEGARVAPATWNRRRASLQQFCRWLRGTGAIGYDVMEGVAGYEAEEQAPRWLDRAEFGRLMRQVEINQHAANTARRKRLALRDAALVAVMAYAGLREGEACGLRTEDVELGARRGRITVRLGKGQKSREVPVSADLRRWLSAWLAEGPGELVFEDISTRAVQKRVAELGAQAGIEGLTPHRLRHSCAKRMLDGGAQLGAVQKILGHAKLETTARYTQPGWEDLEEAVDGVALGKIRKGA